MPCSSTRALLRAVTVFQNIHLLPHVLPHPQVHQLLGEAQLPVHQLSGLGVNIRVQVRFLIRFELQQAVLHQQWGQCDQTVETVYLNSRDSLNRWMETV